MISPVLLENDYALPPPTGIGEQSDTLTFVNQRAISSLVTLPANASVVRTNEKCQMPLLNSIPVRSTCTDLSCQHSDFLP